VSPERPEKEPQTTDNHGTSAGNPVSDDPGSTATDSPNGSSQTSENRSENRKQQGRRAAQPRGLASLFEKHELKDLFRTYLIIICVIEGFIFFVSFLSQLGPETVPFPWKSYFFAAFSVPLAITFLLGIIVISFDRYIFGHQTFPEELGDLFQSATETRSRIHKFHAFLYVIRQVPFLVGLLSLVALSGIAYKLDDILAVVGHVGERTAHYLFIGLAVVFAVAVVVGLIWLFLNYNLRKKTLEFEYQYKKDVVEKTGLILLGGDRVMDQQGNMLSFNQMRGLTHQPGKNDDDDDQTLIIEP